DQARRSGLFAGLLVGMSESRGIDEPSVLRNSQRRARNTVGAHVGLHLRVNQLKIAGAEVGVVPNAIQFARAAGCEGGNQYRLIALVIEVIKYVLVPGIRNAVLRPPPRAIGLFRRWPQSN